MSNAAAAATLDASTTQRDGEAAPTDADESRLDAAAAEEHSRDASESRASLARTTSLSSGGSSSLATKAHGRPIAVATQSRLSEPEAVTRSLRLTRTVGDPGVAPSRALI